MSKTIYCTYLTVYKGNKLPPFYIGSTSVEKINNGYHGSVRSKKYKEIWNHELKANPHLFKTTIITTHDSRQEALEKEEFFHKKLSVVKSTLYINLSLARKNGFFGYDQKGKQFSDKHKSNLSKALTRKIIPINVRNKISATLRERRSIKDKIFNPMYGKTHTEESKKKMSESHKGDKNGSYGTKWFYNPETNHNIKCLPKNKPENYIPGRKLDI
jgi:hypothetical protein